MKEPRGGGDTPAPTGEAFGRYLLLEHLGRGGMADVYKAKSFGVEGFEKVLVIKRIVPELAVHQEFVDMFVQEAKLAVRLSHANIVQVFDLGRIEQTGQDEAYYIAMEYVAGVDLATVLDRSRRRNQPVPFGTAVFVVGEVAKALDHAHRRADESGRPLNIVHRDISPQNILLSWEGDVKVTDFGIARARDTITHDEERSELEADRATGKLVYMSPEQSRAANTDARSDLFSLGTVLYEMISGANPFAASTSTETIRRIGAGECPPVDLVRTDTPAELARIVGKLLAKEPTDRFATAGELAEKLLEYCYRSGERSGAGELAQLLTPLRASPDDPELEPASVLAEPPSAVERTPVEIPHASAPPPSADGMPPTGERREISLMVFSCGARDTDTHGQKLLLRARQVLERHGAWIHRETPSQLVAMFGLGDTDGRDAEAAVRAAMVLVRERAADVTPSAGVHSGPIAVDGGGIPVEDERLAGLLATAQTLARATEGQVAVSQVAGRLVRRSFSLEPLGVTGRAVSDGGLVVRSARATESQRGRFVGRRAELKQLGSILATATRNVPQVVVIRGDTGIGKSRLLTEARRRLERGHFNVAMYVASCPLNGAGIPFSGLRAMLHVLCGTQEDDSPRRILEVRPRLRALGLRDEQAGAMLGLLGAPLRSRAAETRPLLRGGFERTVSSLCKDRLHCFAWDDAQAMDHETLEVVRRVARRRGLRAVFILAQRGEVPERLHKVRGLHVLRLRELSTRSTASFIENQLDARSVPGGLLRFVRKCAGGHPLFLEELLRELCDSGAVRVLSGRVTARPEEQMMAPRTLRTLIASRVSRLPRAERRVLQAVGVLGTPAFTPVLASMLEVALPGLDRYLASLVGQGLIRRTGPTKVRFASPLYREIVLDATPAQVRQDLHARAAATYQESTLPDAGGELAERTAQHLLEAGQRKPAVDLFWRSAEKRLKHGQLEAAVRSMLRTLELAALPERSVDELGRWLSSLSATVSKVRSAPGIRDAVAAVLKEIQARGSNAERATAHVDVARALGSVNLFDEAYQVLEEANIDAIDDVELRREGLVAEIYIAVRQGLFVRAAAAADRIEALGPVEDVPTLLAISQARAATGQTDLALRIIDQVDEQSEPKDALEMASRQKHRQLVHFNACDFPAAAREAKEFAQLARAAGLRYDTAAALHNLGDALTRLGDHAGAYAAFVESLELTRIMENERLGALNRMHLCHLDGLRNDDEAEERLKKLIRFADGHGYLWDVLEGRLLLSRIAVAKEDYAAARKHLGEVIEMAKDHGHELIAHDARELLATVPPDTTRPGVNEGEGSEPPADDGETP